MPSLLYFTDLNDTKYNLNFLDFDNIENQIRNDKALEMVYRVNVGQNQVPPNEDTGMFRNWENDFPRYWEKQYPQSVSSDYTHHLNYKNNAIPNYTAPEVVYLTARFYGLGNTGLGNRNNPMIAPHKPSTYNGSTTYGMHVTEDYNVTWNFEVDSAFTYMVRLHFCEFDELIKKEGDRVFQIFIANTLAEEAADVFSWAGARLVPVHKDYVVTMYSPEGSSQIERVNLSIKLQRLPAKGGTRYSDVLLNGIEILKISDYIRPNPKSVAPLIQSIIVSGLVRRLHDAIKVNPLKKKNKCSSSLPPHLCRYFTIAEIRAATNNFDDVFIIGVGGFGNVYKGCIDGSTLVAIKRLKSGSQQGANEFMNEIELLSQLRHIHLVSL
ncbi:receptor-like protein kinase feronia-like, partial [Trifolium medium]|nr:receptor-like protein kinase feronia-like [Trifolium medium]